MSRSALSLLVALAVHSALAQPDPADPTPLVSKIYAYPSGIPYQVDPVTSAIRGPQVGYNICNSTTQNQQSECQTAFVDNLNDFCLWAPPTPNSTIGDDEAIVVAWCSASGHGTRLIPAGALQAVQVLRTTKYVQVNGYINQVLIDMASSDYGGELDPHGADLRGNPLGGLMYSNIEWSASGLPTLGANNNSYTQIIDWSNFMGGNAFCMTICNPQSSQTDQDAYCQNIYDRMGCSYNAPSYIKNGTFEVCDSDLKIPAGLYVSGGVTMTYSQPDSGVVSPPYTPYLPSSSNCKTYASTDLYPSLPTPTGQTAAATQTGKTTGSSTNSAGVPTSTSSGASALGVSAFASLLAPLFAVAFLS